MLSGRAFRRCGLVAVALVTVFAPGTATAQTGDDPAAGSPPEAVYQIPLEGARRDAAPGKRDTDAGPAGAGGSGGAGGSTSGSAYRSENNFGSSAQVPGTAYAGAGDAAASAGSEGDGSGEGARSIPAAVQTVDEGGTSVAGAVALIALIAAAGIGIVVLAGRTARRGS